MVASSESSGLRPGWIASSLPGLRKAEGTYALFALESLPPLDGAVLDGTLAWLRPLEPELDREVAIYRPEPSHRELVARNFQRIVEAARSAGLALPRAFVRLMESPELQDRFPSSTACYFDLPTGITSAPEQVGGHFVRFLNDQQGCVF